MGLSCVSRQFVNELSETVEEGSSGALAESGCHDSTPEREMRDWRCVEEFLADPALKRLSQDKQVKDAFEKAYAYPSPMSEWILVQEIVAAFKQER
jgi:hypothetical protein